MKEEILGRDDRLSHLRLMTPNTDISLLNELMEYDLMPEQLDGVKKSYLTPTGSAIEAVEMGLGKTVISLGLLQMIAPALSTTNQIAIVTAPTNTINSFKRDIENNTDLRLRVSNGERDRIETSIRMILRNEVDVLLVTPSAWVSSIDFNIFCYNHKDLILAHIYDECKGENENKGFMHFVENANKTPFVFPLNATITGRGIDNLYNMLYACSATNMTMREFRRKYGTREFSKDGPAIMTIDWDDLKRDFGEYFVNVNREDVGAETIYTSVKFHRCEVTEYQREILDKGANRDVLYAPITEDGEIANMPAVAIPAISKLIMTTSTLPTDSNILIYCRNVTPANILAQTYENLGYKVFRIDGYTTPTADSKSKAEKEYNNTKGAVMITSISEGTNLGSTDHVIIYQNPSEVIQYVARAARGFKTKHLTLDWIYYPELEGESFINNIESAINVSVGSDRNVELLYIMFNEATQMYPDDDRLDILYKEMMKYGLCKNL